MSKQTHLKSIKNGRVFLFSETLASRGDLIPCNAKGEIAAGHEAVAEATESTNIRRKTKFLGSVKNGVLYPYSDTLAERDDMVSIDTQEQWESMKLTGQAPEQAPDTIAPKLDESHAPSLQRNKKTDKPNPVKTQADKDAESKTNSVKEPAPVGTSLPSIEGMGPREAKTVLSEWAKMNFGKTIDRRPALSVVVDACRLLAMNAMDKASNQ